MKNKPLTVTFHIGERQVEALTSEQVERMAKKLSESMSTYYTAHPSEFSKIKK